jgi:hypothetical protein
MRLIYAPTPKMFHRYATVVISIQAETYDLVTLVPVYYSDFSSSHVSVKKKMTIIYTITPFICSDFHDETRKCT